MDKTVELYPDGGTIFKLWQKMTRTLNSHVVRPAGRLRRAGEACQPARGGSVRPAAAPPPTRAARPSSPS